MSRAQEAMRSVQLRHIPNGYFWVTTLYSMLESKGYLIYECELHIWQGGNFITLTLVVFGHKQREKEYTIFVYEGPGKENPLVFATIDYRLGGKDPMQIRYKVSNRDDRIMTYYHTLLIFLHAWVHTVLIAGTTPLEDDDETPKSEWYYPVTFETLEQIRNSSLIAPAEFIRKMNSLLQA